MPKNNVSDPITNQEVAFARLILSGIMNDRRAAESVGLNPETAAYTKAKPRIRAYVIVHRAAVSERLVDQEAEGLRKLNLGRDQILSQRIPLPPRKHDPSRPRSPRRSLFASRPPNCLTTPCLANLFINPEKLNRVPAATGYASDAVLNKANSLRRSFSPDRHFSGRRR
jgi:hypothetical protein